MLVLLERSVKEAQSYARLRSKGSYMKLPYYHSIKLRWQFLHCIWRCDSRLKSGFLFFRCSPFSFPSPFVFADIALFQVSSDCNLLASALRTSFFSTHLSHISSARTSMISNGITDISFQVYIKGSRKNLPLSSNVCVPK